MTGQGSGGNVLAALCSFFIPGLGQLLQARLEPEEIEETISNLDPMQVQQIVDNQGNFARKQPQLPNEETQNG